jgi:hypothetical protein
MGAIAAASEIPHDRPDQLAQVQSGLLAGETIYCVYDDKGIGSGFIALTDLRVIILNRSFVSAFPGHKNLSAITSLPYSQIASVATLAAKSFMGSFFSESHIYLVTTGNVHYAVELRGTDRAKYVHDTILWKITPHPPASSP